MITLAELLAYLQETLQVPLFDDYCINGLQVEGKANIKKIATAVSASLETIEEAAACQADLLLVHHGLFWKGDSHVISGTKKKKLELLFSHNISLLGFHLPLDAHREWGNNWGAALELGWEELEPFGIFGKQSIGVKGRVEAIDREAFISILEGYYQHKAHAVLAGPQTIRTVGLISGGAHKSIQEAISQGVDAYITGSFDEPIWNIAKEEKINFFALGHANTEKIGPRRLGEHLAAVYPIQHANLDLHNPF